MFLKQILYLIFLVGLVEIHTSMGQNEGDEWDEWGSWLPCTASCDGGVTIRVRDCNGTYCAGQESQTLVCNTHGCPVNGSWTSFTDWSLCSAACKGGTQTRTRSCTDPEPANGGAVCVGDEQEEQACNQQLCPIDGQWSLWTEWTFCNTDCKQYRYRECDDPEPQHGGRGCLGDAVEDYECSILDCPIDGQWSEWMVLDCDASCHGLKARDCTNPRPLRGGAACQGPSEEIYGECTVHDCIRDGDWGDWSEWSECSKTCSYGIQTRYRECDNPSPRNGGAKCPKTDPYEEERSCYLQTCPKPLVHRKKYKPKTNDIDYALILTVIFGTLGGFTLILLIIFSVRRSQLKRMRDKAVKDRENTPLYKEAAEMSVIPVGKRSAAAKLRRQKLKSKLKKNEDDGRPKTFMDTVFQFEEFDPKSELYRPDSSLSRPGTAESRPGTAVFERPPSQQVSFDTNRVDTPMMMQGLEQIDHQLREMAEQQNAGTKAAPLFTFDQHSTMMMQGLEQIDHQLREMAEQQNAGTKAAPLFTFDQHSTMMMQGLEQIDHQLREMAEQQNAGTKAAPLFTFDQHSTMHHHEAVGGMTSFETLLGIPSNQSGMYGGAGKLPSLGGDSSIKSNRLPPISPRTPPSLDAAMNAKGVLKPAGALPSLQDAMSLKTGGTNQALLQTVSADVHTESGGQGISLHEAMGGGKSSAVKKNANEPMSREEEVDEIVENFWEVPRESIEIITTLAMGSFGLVKKAKAWDLLSSQGPSLVIVKELDLQASPTTRNAFLRELDVLKKLDTHANVISLLGCCTILDPLYMVLEYAPKGELQHFLRRNRPHTPGARPPTSKNLINFSVQIAKGMAFLHKNKVIHGDLTSRNIMIGEKMVCKVSNVARVRNVVENVAEGRLGLRWMSPESICASVQNEHTDAWSFGIILWEIVNFGSTPYPNMPGKDIKSRIKVGYRMPQPEHCTKDLYNLMKYCWNDAPSKRPPLKALASTLWKMNVEGVDHIDVKDFDPKICVDMDDLRPHTPGSIAC